MFQKKGLFKDFLNKPIQLIIKFEILKSFPTPQFFRLKNMLIVFFETNQMLNENYTSNLINDS